jgi:hypothetical protein
MLPAPNGFQGPDLLLYSFGSKRQVLMVGAFGSHSSAKVACRLMLISIVSIGAQIR